MYLKRTKQIAMLLLFALVSNVISVNPAVAAKKPSMSKKMSITVGQTKTLKVKNAKSVKWSILSGKKSISLKKKGKLAVAIKGLKAGVVCVEAKAKVTGKAGSKTLVCVVTVKNKAAKDDSSEATSKSSVPSGAPSVQPVLNITPPPVQGGTPSVRPIQSKAPTKPPVPSILPAEITPAPTIPAEGEAQCIYDLQLETGENSDTGESYAPPCVCNYDTFKYDVFAIWLCRAKLYDPANESVDYRGKKLLFSFKVKNSGTNPINELGIAFNYTRGGDHGTYPFAYYMKNGGVDEDLWQYDEEAGNWYPRRNCLHAIVEDAQLSVGEEKEIVFYFTIPSDAMNGDKNMATGLNYPIMMYISNMKDGSPYRAGDELTILDCKIWNVDGV